MSAQEAIDDVNNVLAELEAAEPAKTGEAAEATEATEATKEASAETEAVKTDGAATESKPSEQEEPASRNGDSRQHPDRQNRNGRDDRNGRGGRGRGRGGFSSSRNNQDNVKSNMIIEEKSSDPVAIRKQVEFYFSDANLPKDQFLLKTVNGSENRPVPLETIRSFKRMRHFEPTEAIVAALKESKLVQMVEDDTKIQRIEALPQHFDDWISGKVELDSIRIFEDKAMPRTVYVKGFGREVPSSQFDIEAFFAPYGPTNAIRLRRTDDKIFKSSVFVEFENEELAQKFVELDPKPKYKDRDLKIMMKKQYCEEKKEDIEAGRIKPSLDRPYNKRGRGGRDRYNDRRKDDDRDWRTRRDEDKRSGFKDRRRDDRERRPRSDKRETEKDENGAPVVKEADSERAAAIAQAKAAVESESKPEVQSEVKQEESIESKKREREDDAADEPAAKKVDVKTEA